MPFVDPDRRAKAIRRWNALSVCSMVGVAVAVAAIACMFVWGVRGDEALRSKLAYYYTLSFALLFVFLIVASLAAWRKEWLKRGR